MSGVERVAGRPLARKRVERRLTRSAQAASASRFAKARHIKEALEEAVFTPKGRDTLLGKKLPISQCAWWDGTRIRFAGYARGPSILSVFAVVVMLGLQFVVAKKGNPNGKAAQSQGNGKSRRY
jgi:hypothetical protein